MTNLKQKKKSNFSLIAGITGAIVGAGATIAGVFALKNPKNRAKVKKVLTNVKKQAVSYAKKAVKKTN